MLMKNKNHTSIGANTWMRVKNTFARIANSPLLTLVGVVLLFISLPSHADFELPTVSIPGITNSSSGIEIVIALIKYVVKMVLWVLVVLVGAGCIKNIIKSVHKVRRDEEAKWADVIGEIIGNVVIVITVILLAGWVTGLLN